ncbi:MAG: CDP-archaeol synthase [Desulfobacteraceae bacterium]|nr:CDP-archaeol synthase [Desulfobacteraceae bacterium]
MLKMTYQIMFLASPLLLAAIAHGLCIKYDWLARLKRPLDFGLTYRGRRIFGDHKTWRGLTINVLFCTLGAFIQAWLQGKGHLPQWLFLVDYKSLALTVGFMLGLGMTIGELPNSFLKRRFEIPPGKSRKGPLGVVFFIYDQVDLAIGIWVFLYFLVRPSPWLVFWSFLLTLALHLAISSVGYLLGMRKTLI